jgi:hypothetical protein
MSLSNTISVVLGATGATLTGGDAVPFVNDGKGTNGRKILVDSTQANPAIRKKIITDVTIGAVAASGSDKLHRTSVVVHMPFANSQGVVYPLPQQFNMAYHPGQTSAEREAQFWNFIGVIIDAELSQLRNLIND